MSVMSVMSTMIRMSMMLFPLLLVWGLGSRSSYGILHVFGLKSLISFRVGTTARNPLANNRNGYIIEYHTYGIIPIICHWIVSRPYVCF